ncbi:LacI family DNA-binding transcriptional regulator [Enterococcus dispar]|uniref:LacI family DNA-binding transcriptional regulator n=1 Tax=Enterococcus dispar TaxID=44009 RepID=UPI00232F28F6|nr:LacI family DNA-binding transcriptional regulator [Enterococcus dispar]WCG34239.1 LacI family DNA-binding transcriptional regulator [Enterococcus dispar]
MKITIKKIAAEAGVSVTTVSNVINNKANRVSDEKKELINQIIKKYDYSPNMNARALVQSSSHLIGLLYFSERPRLDFTDPFVAEVLEGIERVAKEKGFFTLIHNITSQQDIEDIQKNWKFDGLIAVGFNQAFFELINESISVPIVFIDTHLDERVYNNLHEYPNRYFLNTDDFNAAFKPTEYLLQKGHKKIAFLSYDFDLTQSGVVQQRYIGYMSALNAHGIDVKGNLIFTEEDFDTLLSAIDSFTAILVTADYLAMQLIHFLKSNHVFYERQISVIGFDDIKYAALNDPPLTTVRLDQLAKGQKAMEILVSVIGGTKKESEVFNLGSELIIRQTVHQYKNKK